MRFSDKKVAAIISCAIFFIVLDRALKLFARTYDWQRPVIENLFSLDFTINRNIAFSLPFGGIWLEIIISIIIILLIYLFVGLIKKQALEKACFLLFIILGSTSNLYDRIFFGGVIDYLALRYFTVFNLADVMIVSGATILALSVLRTGHKT